MDDLVLYESLKIAKSKTDKLQKMYDTHLEKLIEEFVDIAINNPDVVGIDVAGGPHTSHKYGLKDYEKSFLYAKDKSPSALDIKAIFDVALSTRQDK